MNVREAFSHLFAVILICTALSVRIHQCAIVLFQSVKLPTKQSLPLAHLCMEYEYLVKAIFWGNINRKVYGFLFTS
jgi:hypothetical protein